MAKYDLDQVYVDKIKELFEKNLNAYKSLLIDKDGNEKTCSETLFKAIKDNNAVIAGGSVLSAIIPFNTDDIDVYVNADKAYDLKQKLSTIYNFEKTLYTPAYDNSFFKKNNILGRARGVIKCANRCKLSSFKYIDLLVVNDDVTKTVSNFDLSCCEIWFDGEKAFTTDSKNFENIQNNKATLRKEYNDMLFTHFNLFTINRIKKYISRGIEITFDMDCENTKIISKKNTIEYYKNISNYDEWMIKYLISTYCHVAPVKVYSILQKYHSEGYDYIKFKDQILKGLFVSPNTDEKKLDIKENFLHSFNKIYNTLLKNREDVYNSKLLNIIFTYEHPYNTIQTAIRFKDDINQNIVTIHDDILEVSKISKVSKDGFDIVIYNKTDAEKFINDKNDSKNFIFINSTFKQTLCFNKFDLDIATSDYQDAWFFNCIGKNIPDTLDKQMTADKSKPYVKIPYTIDGNICIVLLNELIALYKSSHKVFELFIDPNKNELTHTISGKLVLNIREMPRNAFISANHCQARSNMTICQIKKVPTYSFEQNLKGGMFSQKRIKKSSLPKKHISKDASEGLKKQKPAQTKTIPVVTRSKSIKRSTSQKPAIQPKLNKSTQVAKN